MNDIGASPIFHFLTFSLSHFLTPSFQTFIAIIFGPSRPQRGVLEGSILHLERLHITIEMIRYNEYCSACGNVSQIDINRSHKSTWTKNNWYRVDVHANRSRSRSRHPFPVVEFVFIIDKSPSFDFIMRGHIERSPVHLASSTTSNGSRVFHTW